MLTRRCLVHRVSVFVGRARPHVVAARALTLAGGAAFLGPGAGGGALLRNPNGDDGRFLDFGTGFKFGATSGFTFAARVRIDSVQNYGNILYLRDISKRDNRKFKIQLIVLSATAIFTRKRSASLLYTLCLRSYSNFSFFKPSSNEVRQTPSTETLAPFFRFLLKPFGGETSIKILSSL